MIFPGSGALKDIGVKKGKNYSVNFPLDAGIDDKTYLSIFKPIISKVSKYIDSAIVLQCGADSLTGDRLGCFNLTSKGHGECVRFVKSFCVPTLVLGGGGYNIRNVARCWAYETSVLLDTEVSDTIPYHNLISYYAPSFKLHLTPTNAINHNPKDRMERIKLEVLQNLKEIDCAPSVQMHQIPPDYYINDESYKDDYIDPDYRKNEEDLDQVAIKDNDFYDGDRDQDLTNKTKKTREL